MDATVPLQLVPEFSLPGILITIVVVVVAIVILRVLLNIALKIAIAAGIAAGLLWFFGLLRFFPLGLAI